jgi:sialate O-acetylesterase
MGLVRLSVFPVACRILALFLLSESVTSAQTGSCDEEPSANPEVQTLIQGPVACRVYQRDRNDRAEIPVTFHSRGKEDSLVAARLSGLPEGASSKFANGKFSDVPTGGPYQLIATAKVAGAEQTITVGPVFVGDLWVLAGQSNMQGMGDLVNVTPPHPKVMALEMNGRWVQAKEPLHGWLLDPGRQKTHPSGAGLGLPFAVTVVESTNVPIGLLPCAVGGTYMTQWDPAKKNEGRQSLYGAMLDQVRKAGGKVKGLLWYQGEAESSLEASKVYPQVFQSFIAAVRRDLEQPDLPFYLVQISRVVGDTRVGNDPNGWNAVREAQRLIPEQVPHTAVVSAIDLELDDFIHVGTQGLKRAGKRLALIALGKLYGQAGAATPTFASVVKGPSSTLLVKFKGVNLRDGDQPGLRPARHIAGFSIRDKDGKPVGFIYDAAVGPDPQTVTLKLVPHRDFPKEGFIWYGYGLDPYCNLSDGLDMAALAFGPIPLANE